MSENTPQRVQLSRRRGWRKPENTVSVARPSQYGNPFRMSRVECELGGLCWEVRGQDLWDQEIVVEHIDDKHAAAVTAVALFREHYFTHPIPVGILRADLRGKNLACWCPLDQPCHADVLLELANGGAS